MPKFIGPLKDADITGYLMPWYIQRDQPVLLSGKVDKTFILPIFSTEEKLREAIDWIKPPADWKIKRIDDGADFVNSVLEWGCAVIIGADPWITDKGNTRFMGVIPSTEIN